MSLVHWEQWKEGREDVRELGRANTWQLLVPQSHCYYQLPHLGLISVASVLGGLQRGQGDQIWDSVSANNCPEICCEQSVR